MKGMTAGTSQCDSSEHPNDRGYSLVPLPSRLQALAELGPWEVPEAFACVRGRRLDLRW